MFPAATKLTILAQILIAVAKITDTKNDTGLSVLMNHYIVTLDVGRYSDRAYSIHSQFYRDLVSRGVKWTTVKEYRDPLFTGVVLRLLSGTDLVRLTDVVGARFVMPLHVQSAPGARMGVEPRASSPSRRGGIPWSYKLTGVDRMHADGYHGKGVTIGIIDSGIDYLHPALGSGFGPGYKVVGGYDFVGDAFTGRDDSPEPRPKADPFERCYGHGTEVAGIVGANPNLERAVIGVAYEANLNAYRVLGCQGGLREDILIDALIRADHDSNDIVTVSLVYASRWKNTMASTIMDVIAERGRIVFVAIGNHGLAGPWSTDFIGRAEGVIGVGSVAMTKEIRSPDSAHPHVFYTSATGPTSDMRLGAALSAPGEEVMTTVIGGGYRLGTGTSMAAPFAAGSIALWLEFKARWHQSTQHVRTALQNTALPMRLYVGDTIDTVAHQGAGLIQVHDAIYSTIRMFPAELLLNDTVHAQLVWTIYIQNLRRRSVTYELTHSPSGTINTMSAKSRHSSSLDFVPQTATIHFTQSLVTVPAGSIKSVVVSVRPPTRLHEPRFPVYSGYVTAKGSDGSTLRSIYLGLAASMKQMNILNPHLTWIRRQMPGDRLTSDGEVYTMRGTDKPVLDLGLWMSTPLLRLELVDASARAGLVVRLLSFSRQRSFSSRTMSRCASWVLLPGTGPARGVCSDRMKIVGLVEERWNGGLIRWGVEHVWSESITVAQFVDGSPITNGQYRLLVRALKRYGNPERKRDYEAWVSPMFIVRRN